MSQYTLQFDGLYQRLAAEGRGYSGIMCYGWVILTNERRVRTGFGGYAHWKLATSNGAEYLGLIAGLEALVEMGACGDSLLIQGDSRTTIEQMQKQGPHPLAAHPAVPPAGPQTLPPV